MKNIYTVILLAVAFVLAGCANDQYSIEKQYWKAQHQAEKIFKNPQASPPNELKKVVAVLSEFANKYSNNSLGVDAGFSITRLYIAKEEYDNARAQLKIILNKYSKSAAICSQALFLIGNSFQLQDKWSLALEQYRKIIQDYPLTARGLDVPVYIANYYKVKYQPDKMLAAFREAVNHYKELANKYPNSPLAYTADTLVSRCYVMMQDWQGAIDSLKTVIGKYNNKVKMDATLIDIALIYSRELKDKAKARENLEKMIKEYPKSRFVNTAKALLKELEKK